MNVTTGAHYSAAARIALAHAESGGYGAAVVGGVRVEITRTTIVEHGKVNWFVMVKDELTGRSSSARDANAYNAVSRALLANAHAR